MKTLLVAIAAIGLSAPMAFAECAYHAKTNAAIDTATTTASITTESQPTSEEMVLLKKTDRVAQDEKTAE
ncbi:hypothetical protein B0E45_05610 [Sinorhizobium sp. A49]|uniref:hypothetical protein n=1 Tax=Sinorhizobium sp. A49 TaxID=1945861 RepID=UPI000986E54C|nr:hypothetical protein [Sinorhizobium sp. A49]OOG74449.1 hypothetical protein B0E45_05610 [Sinorhizobium sp. A49]